MSDYEPLDIVMQREMGRTKVPDEQAAELVQAYKVIGEAIERNETVRAAVRLVLTNRANHAASQLLENRNLWKEPHLGPMYQGMRAAYQIVLNELTVADKIVQAMESAQPDGDQ